MLLHQVTRNITILIFRNFNQVLNTRKREKNMFLSCKSNLLSQDVYILAQFEDFPLLCKSHFKYRFYWNKQIYERVNLLCSSWNGIIFWCHNCNSSPPVNNLVPSKFHDKEVIFDSVCRLPVWTHLYSNCYKRTFRKDLVRISKYILKHTSKNIKRRKGIDTNMWTGAVYKRRWLENADLVFIGCSYFSSICTTVQTADPDVIVHSSRNYLNSLKIIGQNHNIATSCVRLCVREWST